MNKILQIIYTLKIKIYLQIVEDIIYSKKITENIIINKPKYDIKKIRSYNFGERDNENYILCLFHKNKDSSNYLIDFHGNSEDIFSVENYCLYFKSKFNMNVIII